MFEDAIKAKAAEESIRAMDIAELVAAAIEERKPVMAKAVDEKPAEADSVVAEEKPQDTGGDDTE